MDAKYTAVSARDVSDEDSKTRARKKLPIWRAGGWQVAVLCGGVGVFVTLVINVALTAWAVSLPQVAHGDSGRRVLYEGSCDRSKALNIGLHFLINVLSTVIFSASNYYMQCLSAPSRSDVDKAHAQGKWMDIGVMSVRNMLRIGGRRRVLWIVLGLSSLPLHLLFNSVVYSSITARDYTIFGAQESFLEKADFADVTTFDATWRTADYRAQLSAIHADARAGNFGPGALLNLTNLECMQAYATVFQANKQHVVLISEPRETDTKDVMDVRRKDVLGYVVAERGIDAYDWICSREKGFGPVCAETIKDLKRDPEAWSPLWGRRVKYCLAQDMPEQCKLNFSMPIAGIVIGTNVLKLIVFLFFLAIAKEAPLLTIGDAIASFLDRPEPSTKGLCLLTRKMVETKTGQILHPAKWSSKRPRFIAAASRRQLVFNLALELAGIITIGIVISVAIKNTAGPKDLRTLWNLGLGTVTENTLMTSTLPKLGGEATIIHTLLANLPHLIFSLIYFSYNALLTSMLTALEWTSYLSKRASLRVSASRRGLQRQRYILSLPYRYSVPLIVFSVLLHWLISQSLFIVAVELEGEVDWWLMTFGNSPMAMILALALCVVLVGGLVGVALRRLPGAMPVVGTCSLAVAAGCHRSEREGSEVDVAAGAVMWGVLDEGVEDEVGHCGFSAGEVGMPVEGRRYA